MRLAMILVGLVGCASEVEVVDRLDLNGMLGEDDPGVTGVDVDEDGTLVFSTFMGGLWRLDGEDATRILTPGELMNAGVPTTMTDVAVLGDGRYAMTVPGVGVLYDSNDGSVVQHFCYEPGDWGDWEVQSQETHSLAYDVQTERLISQPITLTDAVADRADVAEFDRVTGEPMAWHTLADREFLSTAVEVNGGGVLLAQGDQIFDYVLGEEKPRQRADLGSVDVTTIDGMSIDGDTMLVLDGENQELLWIQGW